MVGFECIQFSMKNNLFQKSIAMKFQLKFYYHIPLLSLYAKAIRILLLTSIKCAGLEPNVPLSLTSIIQRSTHKRSAAQESSKIKLHASSIEAGLI
jgi:hypothetical protein